MVLHVCDYDITLFKSLNPIIIPLPPPLGGLIYPRRGTMLPRAATVGRPGNNGGLGNQDYWILLLDIQIF